MHVRRFSADLKTKIPGSHTGLYGVPIQFDRANLPTSNLDELTQLVNGLPILLKRANDCRGNLPGTAWFHD